MMRVLAIRAQAVALLVCFGCLESGTCIVSGSGIWLVKPPASATVDASNPLATNLVAVWHFDKNPPLNLVNAALSGAYQGSPTLVPTQAGIGIAAPTDSDYLRVADAGNVLNFTSGPFSIAADFYYGAAAPGRVLVGRDRYLVDGYAVQIADDGVGKSVAVAINHGGTADVVLTGPVLTIGAINRVLVTFTGAAVTVYVNGANSAGGAYLAPVLAPESLFVGRDPTRSGMNFDNPITRVAMWNRELAASEALQITKDAPYAYMVAPSMVQPEISSVSVGPVSQTSAVINWVTNVPSDSQVQFGPTTAYGTLTTADATFVTAHAQTVSGLAIGTLYHYQVLSRDATGAIVASSDSTFTPLAGMEFADDFTGSTLDASSWTALTRPGNGGAGEAQYYLAANATVGAGSLALTSRVDTSVPGYSYTSSAVQWSSFSFLYGTVEIRAMLSAGAGLLPALRLVGTDCQQTNILGAGNSGTCNSPLPGSDEIDVAETLDGSVLSVNQQVHSGANNSACQATTTDVGREWHTYGLVWAPGLLEWKIDGVVTCTITGGVPSTPMFLAMNTALGVPGSGTIDDAMLPRAMTVDYVRVYQQTDTTPPTVTGVRPAGGAIGQYHGSGHRDVQRTDGARDNQRGNLPAAGQRCPGPGDRQL